MDSNNNGIHESHTTLKVSKRDKWTGVAIKARDFHAYQIAIMHDWLGTLTLLAAFLIPMFFVLDIFMMPPSLLPRFALYRFISTAITIIQMIIVKRTKPSNWSYLHGYLLTLHVGGMIALMTVDLGGFTSSYYAGLNLVIIGVTLLMPWREFHTFLNVVLILLMYLVLNLINPHVFGMSSLLNNIFFIAATSVLSIGISFVRFRLIRQEFSILTDLQTEKEIVEDRTSSLKSLLDVSGQGFLSFDSSFVISSEYSRECLNIFGKNIAGLFIDQLLYPDENSRQEFRTGMGLFFSGKTKPEVIFDHLDKRFVIQDKTVSTEYKAVHDNRVMLTMTDITEELKRQEELRRENEKWGMIRKVITNRQAFGAFERESKVLFAALINKSKGFDKLLQDIHTFKGNAGFNGFIKTQDSAHHFESFLINQMSLGEALHPEDYIDNLMNTFAEEMMVVTSALGPAWRLDDDSIEVPKSEYLYIEEHIRNYCPDKPIIDTMERHRKKTIAELLARFPVMAEQIAGRLGKRLLPVSILGGSTAVIPEDFDDLIDSFTHIIRNSIDHGIELPGEREAKGKAASGTIGIEIEETPGEILFHFSDDGTGIDFQKVAEKARELGFIQAGNTITNRELLSILFRDNFSTVLNPSNISGRGVGLAALRAAVKSKGGQIKVKTWNDRGTLLTVIIPINRELKTEAMK